MKIRFVNLDSGSSHAVVYSPNEILRLNGDAQDILDFVQNSKIKLFFGVIYEPNMTTWISSPDIRVAHRIGGRYFNLYKLIYGKWKLVKSVRRLPKCWIPELSVCEENIFLAEEALRDKGLDSFIGLLPRDPKYRGFKPKKTLRYQDIRPIGSEVNINNPSVQTLPKVDFIEWKGINTDINVNDK